jgi:hypothetical protein
VDIAFAARMARRLTQKNVRQVGPAGQKSLLFSQLPASKILQNA